MLNVVSVGLGIIMFICALAYYFRIYTLSRAKGHSLNWLILPGLLIIFLIGYIAFEYFLITRREFIDYKTIVSQVFLWGAVFTVICALSIYDNIIVIFKNENELKVTNTRLKELDRMKSNFISNISHELRTPLASIKGFTDTILSEKEMDEKNRFEFLHIIEEETEKLTRLINRLINLSRVELGKIKLKREEFDISSAAREVISSYRSQLELKRLNFEAKLPEKLQVNADPQNFKEALSQILDNSIKFTREYGLIILSVIDKAMDVLVSVSDTGMGIPKEDIPFIFDKFYKVEHPVEQVGGIGIGLALVKSIVEAHSGRIDVESEVGRGTRVTFSIPKGEMEQIIA